MTNTDTTIEKLRSQFNDFRCLVENKNGSSTVEFQSEWKGKTVGVKCINVYMEGINALTGEPISETKPLVTFSQTCTSARMTFSYHGDFSLHFEAVLSQTDKIRDFCQPCTLHLVNERNAPRIEYRVSVKKYWTLLTIYTNCEKRCVDRLWAKYDGHYQKIPAISETESVFYLPTTGSVELITAEKQLPMPTRIN